MSQRRCREAPYTPVEMQPVPIRGARAVTSMAWLDRDKPAANEKLQRALYGTGRDTGFLSKDGNPWPADTFAVNSVSHHPEDELRNRLEILARGPV